MCSEINLRICTNVLVSVHLYSSKNVYVSIVLVRHNWNIFQDINYKRIYLYSGIVK